MRYFMHLAYRGENFHGWQTQPNASSVQQTIEEAISTIVRHPTAIVGAGRTDAGVNARMMIAHLDLPDDFKVDKDDGKFLRGLNTLVGRDIAIYSLRPVAANAHARFDATARYWEDLLTRCHPVNRPAVREKAENAKRHSGPTLFDLIVGEILCKTSVYSHTLTLDGEPVQ